MTRSVPPRSAPAMSASSRAGIAEGCATSVASDGAKRSISACQLASSDAGATSRCGGSPPRARSLAQEQKRQDLDRLAEPHVVRQADAEPQRRRERQPRHAGLLVGPQRAAQIGARVGRGEPAPARAAPRACARARRPPRPATSPRPPPARRPRRRSRVAPASSRMPSRNDSPLVLGLVPHALPVGEHLAEPLAVQLDPLPAQPHQPARRRQELAHLGGRQRLVAQRDRHREVEQRVHAHRAGLLVAHAHGHLGPRRAPRAPPVGHAHDQPRRLEGRNRFQEARAPRPASTPSPRRPRRSRPARRATRPAPRPAAGAPGDGAAPGGRRARKSPPAPAPAADAAPCRRRRRAPRRWRGSRTDAPRRRGSRPGAGTLCRRRATRHDARAASAATGPRCARISSANARPISAQRSATQSPSTYSAPSMGGTVAGQPCALVRRAVDLHTVSPLLEVGHRAEPRHERAAHVAQERERRGEWGVELARAEIEQCMAGSALEGASDAGSGRRATARRWRRPNSGAVSSSSAPEGRMATRTFYRSRSARIFRSPRSGERACVKTCIALDASVAPAGEPLSRVSRRASVRCSEHRGAGGPYAAGTADSRTPEFRARRLRRLRRAHRALPEAELSAAPELRPARRLPPARFDTMCYM